MNTVRSWRDIEANIEQLESYRHSTHAHEVDFYRDLIKRGICFVVTQRSGELAFGPSRFVGYRDNDVDSHKANKTKHGGETNQAINGIIHEEPTEDEHSEVEYRKLCAELGMQPSESGQFGVERKYWVK